jgi:adenylate cyclase
MTTGNYKRRLSALLCTDVKGYSRLMGEDEDATIRTLTNYRNAMANLVEQYRGRHQLYAILRLEEICLRAD